MLATNIQYFESPAEFRRWLEKNHAEAREVWVGYHKKGTGRPSMTWPESVDEALCFGWIDGIRKSVDESSYTIRFTPRKRGSNWSAVNIARVAELTETGRMRPAGLEAFEKRTDDRSRIYAYEQKGAKLDDAYEAKLKANAKAWRYFEAQSPWYRRMTSHWIMSAKREETRLKRLDQLIADSAREQRIPPLIRTKK
jgi:uncharacterized protein YdeI (YjbR/CyaY-like superfamily)